MSNVTLKEVAQMAGVSIKTASRVINGSPDVAESTRLHVEQAVKALSYEPNRLARSLASGKSNTIGIIIHHSVQQTFHYPFFSELLCGISACLNQNQQDMLLRFMDSDGSYTELYDQRRVDGLIITNAPINNPQINKLIEKRAPYIFTSRITLEGNTSHWVDSDFSTGIKQATEYLLSLGHRRIAINLGPRTLALSHLRAIGYSDALKSYDIPLHSELMVFGGLFLEAERIKTCLLDNWLALPQPPTAIISSDDLSAVNTIKELTQLGCRVPEDISVVGVDDTLLAHVMTPPLTSIRQQAYNKGYIAANNLLQIIGTPTESPLQVELDMELMVRESTGPAPVL
jgi:LacI family transcriptional regulator